MLIHTLKEFEGGSEPLGFYIKGHVSKHAFAASLRRDYGQAAARADDVVYVWYRCVPSGHAVTLQETVPGRGAFPATVWDYRRYAA